MSARFGAEARALGGVGRAGMAGSALVTSAFSRTTGRSGGALSTRGGRVCARAGGTSARACTSFLSASGVSAAARIGAGTCGADWLPGCLRGGSRDGDLVASSAFGSGAAVADELGSGGRMDLRGVSGSAAPCPPGRNLAGISTWVSRAAVAAADTAPARRTHHLGRDRLRARLAHAAGLRTRRLRGLRLRSRSGGDRGCGTWAVAGAREQAFRREADGAATGGARDRAASAASFCSSTAEGGSHTSRHMRSSTVLRARRDRRLGRHRAPRRDVVVGIDAYTRLTVANVRLRQS